MCIRDSNSRNVRSKARKLKCRNAEQLEWFLIFGPPCQQPWLRCQTCSPLLLTPAQSLRLCPSESQSRSTGLHYQGLEESHSCSLCIFVEHQDYHTKISNSAKHYKCHLSLVAFERKPCHQRPSPCDGPCEAAERGLAGSCRNISHRGEKISKFFYPTWTLD